MSIRKRKSELPSNPAECELTMSELLGIGDREFQNRIKARGYGARGNLRVRNREYAKALYHTWVIHEKDADGNYPVGVERRDGGPMDDPPFIDNGADEDYLVPDTTKY